MAFIGIDKYVEYTGD